MSKTNKNSNKLDKNELDNIVLDKKDFLESNDGIATLLSTPKKKALDVFVKRFKQLLPNHITVNMV